LDFLWCQVEEAVNDLIDLDFERVESRVISSSIAATALSQ
jgi:hypothetical protein